MKPSTVAISGLGFITNIGTDASTVAQHLRTGTHGFRKVDLRPGLDLPIKLAGTIEDYQFPSPQPSDWQLPATSRVASDELASLPPHGVYGIDALEQALDQAGITPEVRQAPSTGLFAASGGSPFLLSHHLRDYEARHWRRGHPLALVRSVAGTLNFNLASRYGIRGASAGFVSACTSSSHALGYAYDEIHWGRQDRMLVIGAEEGFVENVIPFDAMRALTAKTNPDTACRPFDRDRDGFIVTGGAVAMVLERADRTMSAPLALMRGWGQASDGHHVASPHPQGAGIEEAMRRALAQASVTADEVDYVNAHATSTQAGDRAEALALQKVFGQTSQPPAIVSTKGLTGHGLSLSGIMEAALAVLSLQEGFLPGNRNLDHPDEACQGLPYPTQCTRPDRLRIAINNSSGFGGSNVCHVFEKR